MNKPAPELTAFEPADEAAEARAIAEAEAQVLAGKVISHDAVRRWLKSWGTADELPLAQLAEESRSFDFLADEPDLYSEHVS